MMMNDQLLYLRDPFLSGNWLFWKSCAGLKGEKWDLLGFAVRRCWAFWIVASVLIVRVSDVWRFADDEDKRLGVLRMLKQKQTLY